MAWNIHNRAQPGRYRKPDCFAAPLFRGTVPGLLVLNVLLLWRIALSIIKPLRQIANGMNTLDNGDTTVALDIRVVFQSILKSQKKKVLVASDVCRVAKIQ